MTPRGPKAMPADLRCTRNRAITAAFCAGETPTTIGPRHGVTPRFVRYLMKQLDLAKPQGRPSILRTLNAEQQGDYSRLRRAVGATAAREAMGGAIWDGLTTT